VPFGEQPNGHRPSLQPGQSNAQEGTGAKHSPFSSAERQSAQGSHPGQEPFSAYPWADPPFPSQPWTGPDQGRQTEARLNDANQAAHGYPPEPYPGYFHANGMADPAAFLHGHIPGSSSPPEKSGVSPLHATLIVLILLAGLAFGVGRWFWIDDKLDLASAKKSSVAALPSTQDIDESSSIQSSIDSVYIPSMPGADDIAASQDVPVAQAAVPDQAHEKPELSAAAPATTQSQAPQKDGAAQAIQETARTKADSRNLDSEGARPDKLNAREEQKRPSQSERAPQKSASAAKKERMKEIDRVRTQAYSETTKDRIGERKSGSAGSSNGASSEKRSSYRTRRIAQSTVTNAEYARCLRIDHIIRREQCKWSLCNNKWGKGACPAY
jgi:hypothetical protein